MTHFNPELTAAERAQFARVRTVGELFIGELEQAFDGELGPMVGQVLQMAGGLALANVVPLGEFLRAAQEAYELQAVLQGKGPVQ